MPRRPQVPSVLTRGPFTVAQALDSGLSRRQLESSVWRRLHTGVYVHRDLPVGDAVRSQALRLAAPAGVAFAGLTAAWVHGLWTPPPGVDVPLTTTRDPAAAGVESALHRSRRQLLRAEDDDTVVVGGVLVTSVSRTAFDLLRDVPLVERVSVLDTFAAAGLDLAEFAEYVDRHRRWPGVAFARTALSLCHGASRSVGETRLRMTVVLAGLPEPWVNPSLLLTTPEGRVLRFPDLLVRGRRRVFALEFDGGYHDDARQRDADAARENLLLVQADLPVLRYRWATLWPAQRVMLEIARAIEWQPMNDLRPADFARPRHRLPW